LNPSPRPGKSPKTAPPTGKKSATITSASDSSRLATHGPSLFSKTLTINEGAMSHPFKEAKTISWISTFLDTPHQDRDLPQKRRFSAAAGSAIHPYFYESPPIPSSLNKKTKIVLARPKIGYTFWLTVCLVG
jgi:hypothetical protein